MVLVACRRHQGVGIYAWSGGSPWKPQRGTCLNPAFTYCTNSRGPKGNIMIDNNGRAVLTNSSLVTLTSDQSTSVLPGILCWMSPELLEPGKFGLSGGRLTRESDCYTLGMVMYEVLSGHAPFAEQAPYTVILKVLSGKRPERPRGETGKLLTDAIWDVMELCWKAEPRERATAKVVLRCLEGNSPSIDGDDDQSGTAAIDSQCVPSVSFQDRSYLRLPYYRTTN